MGQHKIKDHQKVAAQLRELARLEFLESVKKSSFVERLKFCWMVLFR